MFEKSILNDIFISDESGEKYIVLDRNDKTWILPVDKLKPALEMYQPATKQDKMLKQSLPLIKNNSKALNKAGVFAGKYSMSENILEYIKKTAGIENDNFYIAGYIGDATSKENDKVTLQFYNDEKIICYAKITKEPEVSKLFEHEIQALAFLKEKDISNLPEILGTESIDGMDVFLQSTKKSLNEKVKLEFEAKQIEFADELVNRMKITCKYEETEFYEQIQYLKKKIKTDYPSNERMIINHSIKILEKKLAGTTGDYSFSHGDYTPWNVYYMADKTLCAFDFEYCKYIMPCYIDVFHYMTQVSLLGNKNDADKTIYVYEKNRKLLEKYISDTDFTYLCYLLSIISFYNKRTIGKFDVDDRQYRDWIAIISYINSRLD